MFGWLSRETQINLIYLCLNIKKNKVKPQFLLIIYVVFESVKLTASRRTTLM